MDVPSVPGYVLLEPIGAGGGGRVWRARRDRDGLGVAVKIVPVPDAVLGTLRAEADQVAAEIGLMQVHASDHIVRCHEALAVAAPAPAIAMVMDLMEGGSLADVLHARGHLSLGETITVVSPMARALASLHAGGVVHGDVSPGNVLFDRSGRPSLSDLGVARAVGDREGGVFGTIGFTAPEVELGAHATPPSDVYSLGALAWMCLTGTPPAVAALRTSLDAEAPGLAEAARRLVVACLAGDPKVRPTAGEAALGFFDCAPAEPIRLVTADDDVALLTRRIRAAAVHGDDPDAAATRQQGPRRWPRRRSWRATRSGPSSGARRGTRSDTRGRTSSDSRSSSRRLPTRAQLRRWAAVGVLLAALTSAFGWHRLASAESAQARLPARDAPAAPRNAPAAPVDVLADHARVTADPVAVVNALSQLRARAWNAGDVLLLLACDAPNSVALAHDRELLEQAGRNGATYAGVAFRVVSARLGDATQTTARVVARVDSTAYDVAVDGRITHVAARPSPPMEFRLRWAGRRWLVAEVRAVTAPS